MYSLFRKKRKRKSAKNEEQKKKNEHRREAASAWILIIQTRLGLKEKQRWRYIFTQMNY